jgi:transcriptional regulator GlxA family with amidase domain
MGRLCDCVVPLANLPEPWPDLWQVAADPGRSVTERIACCEAFLAAQKVPSEHNLPLSEAFLDDLMQRPEHCEGIGDYADQLHVSARSLRRHFRQAIGLSPKLFLRIRRFHQMIHLMRNTPGLSTMDMVFLGGYHDQAHLAKEFKEFAGLSLRTYLQGDYAWATRSVLAVPMPQVRS